MNLGKLLGLSKKQSGRTPARPRREAQHEINRWASETRTELILRGIRLGVVDSARPVVGQGAQYKTWKSLAVAVERKRKELADAELKAREDEEK